MFKHFFVDLEVLSLRKASALMEKISVVERAL